MKVKIATHNNPDDTLLSNAKNLLEGFLSDCDYRFTDNDANIIFFASGGSEKSALDSYSKSANPIILLAYSRNNSYASATETLSYFINNKINAILINIEDANAKADFNSALKTNVNSDLKANIKPKPEKLTPTKTVNLSGKKIALIGKISNWLVNSDVDKNTVAELFGIELIHLPWNVLPNYRSLDIDEELINNFPSTPREMLLETSKVYRLLKNIINEHNLSGLTIECFPMAQQHKTTACLPLALLNSQGIAASCEGDLTALIGMLYIKEQTGKIPWQANLASINGNKVLWAHCTAPLNMLSDIKITTHYETSAGTAIKGRIDAKECNIFRFDKTLKRRFQCKGEIVATPQYNFACRTQIETILSTDYIRELKEDPLGNHHLIWV